MEYLRKNGISVGENTDIMSPLHSDIDVGRGDFISIGNNCVISAGVSIIAHDYSWKNLAVSNGVLYPSGGKPIKIGNNVFIGANSTILGGVTIGDNSIIAAGSVVCKSVQTNTVCGGNPAKTIMSLEEYFAKRKQQYLEDAKENVRHIYQVKGRRPMVEEMRNFIVLFMPRTEQYYSEYVYKHYLVGMSKTEYVKLLEQTEALYDSYEDFLNDALNDV